MPYNIIIAGVGGQGVNTLTRIVCDICEQKGMKCQSSMFKGGAQRLGSIHSELRIFSDGNPYYNFYSSQIKIGDLDLLIGLEPWETLRYSHYFNQKTSIFMNTRISPLFFGRSQSIE